MLKDDFETFCKEIRLQNQDNMEISAGEIAKKLNKEYYGLEKDNTSHLYIVGSVGRGTAIDGASDLDILFDLPSEVYDRFDKYSSNGQSSLLQEVKEVLKSRYPKTDIRGDGQVVVIDFTGYTVELVPGFKQADDSFKYPDTHDGGSWKITKPLEEQKECGSCNSSSNGVYYDFCHMVRSWKNKKGFLFGGLLIDTLVYNHFSNNDNFSDKGYNDYLDILKSLFAYLKGLNPEQSYWFAVGSNQHVMNSGQGAFVDEAQKAYEVLAEVGDNRINDVLIDLFGNEFPKQITKAEECASLRYDSQSNMSQTEQFIEDMFPVDIRYRLSIDCKVTQNGFRTYTLRTFLNKYGTKLPINKHLEFYINSDDYPNGSDIYWKVRNVGAEAIRRNQIRGQINRTNRTSQIENTSFSGPHFVECYIIKNGVCIARDRIEVPIE
ncbi:MAG: nucleotidyltransferase domain-containing protein [Oscillospiraceae bacterium]|nr:nucleotidyltransferase domain-containing protein [Oscillospiraceae bacterium]